MIGADKLFVVCYPESLPDVDKAIAESKCDNFAYILHDKDTDVNGEIKKAHWHVLLTFSEDRSFEEIGKLFKCGTNNVEKMKTIKAAVRYLRHLDNPEKYQYPAEDVQKRDGWNIERYYSGGEDDVKAAEALNIVQTVAYNGGSFADVISRCCENGLYSYLRRGGALFLQVYKETKRARRAEEYEE